MRCPCTGWRGSIEVGAFTNLTRDHLNYHKDMESYAQAKSKLFKISKKSVINMDDSTAR